MKFKPRTVKRICDHLRSGNTREHASILSGISKDTFYQWIKTKPDFADAIERAELECEAAHILNVRTFALGINGQKPTWQASAWWLERTNPDRFALKWQGELSGRGGKPLVPATPEAEKLKEFSTKDLHALLVTLTPKAEDPLKSDAPEHGPANGSGG